MILKSSILFSLALFAVVSIIIFSHAHFSAIARSLFYYNAASRSGEGVPPLAAQALYTRFYEPSSAPLRCYPSFSFRRYSPLNITILMPIIRIFSSIAPIILMANYASAFRFSHYAARSHTPQDHRIFSI